LVEEANCGVVAWTPTPRTLPSNLALCVHPDGQYVKMSDKTVRSYIVHEKYVDNLHLSDTIIIPYKIGRDMVGMEYFTDNGQRSFKIICDPFVEIAGGTGTGVVHCFAPETKILMSDYTTREIKDIKIGDKVWGDDNTIMPVTGITPKMNGEMYEIKQNKGVTYHVNKDHILVLRAASRQLSVENINTQYHGVYQ